MSKLNIECSIKKIIYILEVIEHPAKNQDALLHIKLGIYQ